jgi:spore coat-associated protein N
MDGSKRLVAVAVLALLFIGITVDADRTAASFTATTDNPGNAFVTAKLALTNDKAAAGALVNLTKLVPGDTISRTVTLTNTGDVGFTYAFAASQAGNTLLWSDAVNGLQVTASRGATVLYAGALKNMGTVAVATPVASGGTDTVSYVFTLPVTAGNTFQSLSQDLTITYTATQLAGTAR